MQNQSDKTLPKVEVPLITTNQPRVQEAFRNKPANFRCLSCGKNISTQLEYHNGLLTYASCVGIFLLGGACGCCLIPFCVKACKDVDHKCPNCQRYVGSYRRLGD
ncbi:Lipopolysaccharide-induced tumor necrosis factor-alpha factor [Schistosoma japonicum]|uniref:Lipopolysaccharide-induced tumor necrosis factor-alpha factor n=2 Tax=Schistosoma japonicum TaxID=6182 RepID=A0A4Z2DCN6_SCHJA|nr:Lipopolysaccharide-induced tumor necrosis factor-alpha factor like [Schistosoma japonicum]TNN14225.1 Lipopolysaccharide-induced tumor necrosis factor-alpha factor [Schistosoma japonicum]